MISVVVPTRNNESTIRMLLDSLKQQEYRDFEVIVVDSSEDKTPEIASEYPFVKVVRVPPRGANLARNIGVKLSKGDIIAFTDGDCRVSHDWLKNIAEFFEKHRNTIAVGGSVYTARELKGSIVAEYYNEALWPMMPIYSSEVKITRENFHKVRVPNSNNLAFRRKVFDEGFLFDEEFRGGYEETELLWRLCLQNYDIRVSPSIKVEHYHTKSLRKLLKRAYNYGRGHYLFYSKYRNCPLALYGTLSAAILYTYFAVALAALIVGCWYFAALLPVAYIVLSILYLKKTKKLRSLVYFLIDIVFYTTMAAGIFVELLKRLKLS